MENSPLDPVETRYEAAKRARDRICLRRTHAPARHSSDEPGEPDDPARKRAARSGRRRMGHRIQVTHRKPTQPSTGSSGRVGRPAASRGLVMRGDASNAPVRARRSGARRSLERRRARRARHRGAARILPRAGRAALESGESGGGKAGTGTARFARHGDGADVRMTGLASCAATSVTGTVTRRSRGRKPERERSPARDSAAGQNPCIVAVGSTTRCTTP